MTNPSFIRAKFLHGSEYLSGAHHPHCDRYFHHLVWIRGHPLCLGCTCFFLGLPLGTVLAMSFSWSTVSFLEWLVFHLVLLIPTAIQAWMQRKSFKIISRTLLGISTGSYFITGLVFTDFFGAVWSFRVAVLSVFFLVYKSLNGLRKSYPDDPCTTCPLGVYPTCDWNLPRLLASNGDPVLRAALVQQSMQGSDTAS